jgi:hypothetical protein
MPTVGGHGLCCQRAGVRPMTLLTTQGENRGSPLIIGRRQLPNRRGVGIRRRSPPLGRRTPHSARPQRSARQQVWCVKAVPKEHRLKINKDKPRSSQRLTGSLRCSDGWQFACGNVFLGVASQSLNHSSTKSLRNQSAATGRPRVIRPGLASRHPTAEALELHCGTSIGERGRLFVAGSTSFRRRPDRAQLGPDAVQARHGHQQFGWRESGLHNAVRRPRHRDRPAQPKDGHQAGIRPSHIVGPVRAHLSAHGPVLSGGSA